MSDIARTLREIANGAKAGESVMANANRLRDAALEIEMLRSALVRYGERARMSNAIDPAMQQAIDRAFETAT